VGPPVVPDLRPGLGPLGGIYTALMHARTPLVLVLACDLPHVDTRFLAHLARSIGGAEVCLPRDARGWHPLCACYATRCAPQIAARLDAGHLKVIDAVATLRRVEIGPDELSTFDPSGLLLANVNSARDYAALTRPR
jgi:molybdopterin-guanine dinucleotide biosynthesis protein A